jgi:hypothetical protein
MKTLSPFLYHRYQDSVHSSSYWDYLPLNCGVQIQGSLNHWQLKIAFTTSTGSLLTPFPGNVAEVLSRRPLRPVPSRILSRQTGRQTLKTFFDVKTTTQTSPALFRTPLRILTLIAVIMGLPPDLVTNIAFGLAMIVIGVAGIWIVKWSTDRMVDVTRRQGKLSYNVTRSHLPLLIWAAYSFGSREPHASNSTRTPSTRSD